MKNAIRYYSKFGHSKMMAEAVKDLVEAEPQTVNEPLAEGVDTLLLGAGVFMGKVNSDVFKFIDTLSPDKVKRVVCFGSCAIVKSPVPQMRKALEAKGIKVDSREFVCPGAMGPIKAGHPNDEEIKNFRQFVKDVLNN